MQQEGSDMFLSF